jgi:hypothetical protein
MSEQRKRAAGFFAVVLVALAIGGLYMSHAIERDNERAANAPPTTFAHGAELDRVLASRHVLFQSTAYGDSYGRVGVLPTHDIGRPRLITELSCDRVAASVERGICLHDDRGMFKGFKATIFDKSFKPVATLPIEGMPSRASVSADSRWAAATTFVEGHSYAAASFSTSTVLYDLEANKTIGNLEEFAVMKDGERIQAIDFNFWGVTFASDSDTFYATLGTGGKNYLVRGSIAERAVVVLRDGVECPSLSPDGTRIAFKSRRSGMPVKWQLSVLDLSTLVDHPVAETRSVDDQVQWLDDQTLIYGLFEHGGGIAGSNTWVVPSNGSGRAELFTKATWSTVVVPSEL